MFALLCSGQRVDILIVQLRSLIYCERFSEGVLWCFG